MVQPSPQVFGHLHRTQVVKNKHPKKLQNRSSIYTHPTFFEVSWISINRFCYEAPGISTSQAGVNPARLRSTTKHYTSGRV